MSYQYSYGSGGGGGGGGAGGGHPGYSGQPGQQQQHGYSQGGGIGNQHGYGQGQGSRPQQSYTQSGGGGGGYGGSSSGGGGYGGGGGYHGGGGGGGYQAGAGYHASGGHRPQAYTNQSGPPRGADQQLWSWFVSVDRDGSGHINPVELQQALVNGDWSPFELDTVKLLMSMFDTDRSGAITFNEFVGLWNYIQEWQGVFRHFDADRSGSIDQSELSRALSNFGYNLNPRLLQVVVQKFVPPPPSPLANHRNTITFDRFVRCCVVIKTLTESFVSRDTQRTGRITLTYDEFMEMCLSAP